MTTAAFWNAQEPKELFWIEGASHGDLYDKEEYAPTVVAELYACREGGARCD